MDIKAEPTVKFFIQCYKIQVQDYVVSKFTSFGLPNSFTFFPLPILVPITLAWRYETRIKVFITATSKLFGTQEKLLCQALKRVCYKSGSQKCRREDTACDKQEDSSSSEETDDDEDKGAVTRIKLFKKKHKK